MKRLEDQFQRNLNAWWRLQYPQTWKKTVHVPSEMPAKSRVSAAIAKGLGWKAGIPDILCFARRGGYSGLAIELKIGSNKPCLLYTSPSPRDLSTSRMPSSA